MFYINQLTIYQEVKCFVSSDISKSYRFTWNNDFSVKKKISGQTVYECYYCGKYVRDKEKYLCHLGQCSGIPGIVYDFNTQNLISYENLKYKGDLPMTHILTLRRLHQPKTQFMTLHKEKCLLYLM